MKKILIILGLVIFSTNIVADKDSGDFSYFRTEFERDTVWVFESESFSGHLSVVLSNAAKWKPKFLEERFGEKLSELEIPLLLRFFRQQGWEVMSHDSETVWVPGGDTVYCDVTFMLRRMK